MPALKLPQIVLKKREERRIRAGHPWIFSNEVDAARSPLTDFAPGDFVTVCSQSGMLLGSAYVNPHALICARMIDRKADTVLDESLLVARLGKALSVREQHFDKPFYRLVYGESDQLPGLVVDRFGDVLVLQISTAGMDRLSQTIISALCELLSPIAVVLRNDSTSRQHEGLESFSKVTHGSLPDELHIEEFGSQFEVDVLHGQKTGWFYDHALNRRAMTGWVKGKRVLDLFSYSGAWGVQAAVHGADSVLCVDSSESALALLGRNAALNGVAAKVEARKANVFDALKALRDSAQTFDVVIADPPALIGRRKDVKAGTEAYRQLNRLAMQVLTGDGMLISASCSFHLPRDRLVSLLAGVAFSLNCPTQLLWQGHQAPDHPVLPALTESEYLKCLVFCTRR